MEPTRYYIPTRGRVGKQETVKNLPRGLHPLVTIVCPQEEVGEHRRDWPEVQVVAQPSTIQTIGTKREWILRDLADSVEFAWMLDDDLKFKVCVDGRFLSSAKYPDEFAQAMMTNLPALWAPDGGDYGVVGIGTSYFAPKGGIKENYHLGFAFGFCREVRNKLKLGRLDVFEDIDYTLQCLRAGYTIAVTYDVTVDQVSASVSDDPADGGVAGERTLQTIRENLDRLIGYHPGIVSEKPRRPGAHPAAITKVLWQRAAKEGRMLSKEEP